MTETLSRFIHGQKVAGVSDRHGEVFDPATGAVFARVPLASANDVKSTIDAAIAGVAGFAHKRTAPGCSWPAMA